VRSRLYKIESTGRESLSQESIYHCNRLRRLSRRLRRFFGMMRQAPRARMPKTAGTIHGQSMEPDGPFEAP